MRGSTKKSLTKLNAAENKLTQMICLRMEKTYTTKTPPGDFKVITPKNPLLSKQVITSKGILVSYTNLQLNSYLNT